MFNLGVLSGEELELPASLLKKVVRSKPPVTINLLKARAWRPGSSKFLIYTGSPILRSMTERPDKAAMDSYRQCGINMVRKVCTCLRELRETGVGVPSACDIVSAYPEDLKEFQSDPLFERVNITRFVPDIDRMLPEYEFCVVRGGANIVSSCIYLRVPAFCVATQKDEQQITELGFLERHGYLSGMDSETRNLGKLSGWIGEVLRAQSGFAVKNDFHGRPEFSEVLARTIDRAFGQKAD